jgi:CubicO group peptidase (beta-lactamase class C family)
MCTRPGQPAAATVAPNSPSFETLRSPAGAGDIACEQAWNDGLIAGGDHGSGLSWTALGVRMGLTIEQPQRVGNLAAIGRMNWTERPPQHFWLDGSAARAVVKAVTCGRLHPRLYRIGSVDLGEGRQLIGLENTAGVGSFLIDLRAEVIHVLTISRAPAPTPSSARRCCAVEETR